MEKPPSLSLAAELERRGIRPSRRLGQNFMIDRNMLDFLVRTAAVTGDDLVFEVGAGAGFLTERLAERARHVVSVELDAGLFGLCAERLSGYTNLTLLHADALEGQHVWSGPVRSALEEMVSRNRAQPLKLVANLPYSIATATVQAVLEGEAAFAGMWFTCQKEVAERLTARPGSDDYGFISVLTALLADVRIVRMLPPSVFWPQPKVDSAIVELLPSAAKRALIGDMAAVRRGLSALFTLRRKQLAAALRKTGVDRGDIIKLGNLSGLGIDAGRRVYTLSADELRKIAETLFAVERPPDGGAR